jgi:rubrerythrin
MHQHTLTPTSVHFAIETAIEMEHLGGDFYQSLASTVIDPELADLCRKLAAAEAKHCEYFRQIRSKLAERGETVILRDDELAEARQIAREAIFPNKDAVTKLLTEGNLAGLVEMARQIEQSAIDYYTSIAAVLPESDAINTLIRAEQIHLRMLNEYRA